MSLQLGRSAAVARTISSNVFVFGEIFYLFNCRSLQYSIFRTRPFGNKPLLCGVLAMTILQILFTYAPFMNIAFHSEPISPIDWLFIIGVGAAIFIIIELLKTIQNMSIFMKTGQIETLRLAHTNVEPSASRVERKCAMKTQRTGLKERPL